MQHIAEQAVRGELEDDAVLAPPLVDRQLDAVLVEPLVQLADAARHAERAEDERDCLLNALVRILDQPAERVERVARCDHAEELTLACLVVRAGEQSLAQYLELHNAESAFDAEHELIVEQREVVKVIAVADQRVEDLANLEQAAPVLVGARQS